MSSYQLLILSFIHLVMMCSVKRMKNSFMIYSNNKSNNDPHKQALVENFKITLNRSSAFNAVK